MRTFDKFLLIKLLSIYVLVVSSEDEWDLPCKFSDSINITEGNKIYPDGSILHNNLLYKRENYAWINYTADSNGPISVDEYYLRGCICQVTNCVWLCCDYYEDIEGIPTCTDPMFAKLEVEVVDQSRASFKIDLIGNSSLHKAPRMILENMFTMSNEEWSMNSTGYVHTYEDFFFQDLYCLSEGNDSALMNHYFVPELQVSHIVALSISLPFMLVTLFIYLCLSELRNIHGKCLICYVLSMFFCFSILLYTKLAGPFYYCYYYQYFWTMAGFFWLNVLCFDIFWTFSSGVVKKSEKRRFLNYSMYAWGLPMILLVLLAIIDNTSFIPKEFRPQILADHCFFEGEPYVQLIYLYSILLVLILINILFFVITLTRIIGIQRATDAVLQRGSRRHSSGENRYRIHLYLRLFVVMGVTWIFEVISATVCPEGSCMHVPDMLNCLLGVFIFLMFVCKTNVKQMILKRLGKGKSLSRSKSNFTISTSVASTKDATIPLRQLSRMESCPEKYTDDRYY